MIIEKLEIKVSLPSTLSNPYGAHGYLIVLFDEKSVEGFRSIDLKTPKELGKEGWKLITLSICGNVYDRGFRSGGQNKDTVMELWGHIPEVRELCEIWNRWHLNHMRAGTREQSKVLESRPDTNPTTDWYYDSCLYLARKGLLFDRGYQFGYEWLFEPIPKKVIARINYLVEKINRG